MPEWREMQTCQIDGIDLVVKERTDQRNRQGATEYIISASKGGEYILQERHPSNVWIGHCDGLLLLPIIAERANKQVTRTIRS